MNDAHSPSIPDNIQPEIDINIDTVRRRPWPRVLVTPSFTFSDSPSSGSASSPASRQYSPPAHDEDYVYSSSPLTFARIDSPDTYDDELLYGRRRSLLLDIPVIIPPVDDADIIREGRRKSITNTRRTSRSLDSALRRTISGPSDLNARIQEPISEPGSKGDWLSLEDKLRPPNVGDDPILTDLDESYIFSGLDGVVDPQLVSKQSQGQQGRKWNKLLRPQSAITTTSSIEDSFIGLVGKQDEGYGNEKAFWTFKREKSESYSPVSPVIPVEQNAAANSKSNTRKRNPGAKGKAKGKPSAKGMAVGTHEYWKFESVGRFRVDRVAYQREYSPHQCV